MIRDSIEEQPVNTNIRDLLYRRLANDARVVNIESREYNSTWKNGKVTSSIYRECTSS